MARYEPVEWKDDTPGVHAGTLIDKARLDRMQKQYLLAAGIQELDVLPSDPGHNVCIVDDVLNVRSGDRWVSVPCTQKGIEPWSATMTYDIWGVTMRNGILFTSQIPDNRGRDPLKDHVAWTESSQTFVIRGAVDTEDDLPSDPRKGESYFVHRTGHLWMWDGSVWVDLGVGLDTDILEATANKVKVEDAADEYQYPTAMSVKDELERVDRRIDQEAEDRENAIDNIGWDGVKNKPEAFAPSPHAATHRPGGEDPLDGLYARISSGKIPIALIPTANAVDSLPIQKEQFLDGEYLYFDLQAGGIRSRSIINGVFIGAFDTFSQLPSSANLGDQSTVLNADQVHKAGLYSWNGTEWKFMYGVAIDLTPYQFVSNIRSDLNAPDGSTYPSTQLLSGVKAALEAGKVDKRISGSEVYTHAGTTQGGIPYSDVPSNSAMVRRKNNAQISLPITPLVESDAASKGYVDAELAKKVDGATLAPNRMLRSDADGKAIASGLEESNIVTIDGSQTIRGMKVFTGPLLGIRRDTAQVIINVKRADLSVKNVPGKPWGRLGRLQFLGAEEKATGIIECNTSDTFAEIRFLAYNIAADMAHTEAAFAFRRYIDGRGLLLLPSPPDNAVSGEATTAQWVNNKLAAKQNAILRFTNVNPTWSTTGAIPGYPYRGSIPASGVTAAMDADVRFDSADASSGNYAPICETGTGVVYIWSKTNVPITIPRIVVIP